MPVPYSGSAHRTITRAEYLRGLQRLEYAGLAHKVGTRNQQYWIMTHDLTIIIACEDGGGCGAAETIGSPYCHSVTTKRFNLLIGPLTDPGQKCLHHRFLYQGKTGLRLAQPRHCGSSCQHAVLACASGKLWQGHQDIDTSLISSHAMAAHLPRPLNTLPHS
ncbi:hypothetical protein OG21DRAFT_532935 [Imleria badia]|nr:hypothetical protein OG21DRAFT_532935 [Imleria badia]